MCTPLLPLSAWSTPNLILYKLAELCFLGLKFINKSANLQIIFHGYVTNRNVMRHILISISLKTIYADNYVFSRLFIRAVICAYLFFYVGIIKKELPSFLVINESISLRLIALAFLSLYFFCPFLFNSPLFIVIFSL